MILKLTLDSLLLFLTVGQAAEPVTWLDKSRVQVATIIKNSDSPRAHAEAQFKLMRLAKRACKKIDGRAGSEGKLYLDNVAVSEKKTRLQLSEIYVCVPK